MLVSTAVLVGIRTAEARLRRLLERSPRPYKVLLELTSDCNSRCKRCSIWKTPAREKREELDLADIEGFFALSGKDIVWLALSGGEITLFDELGRVADLARRYCPRLRLVTFTTNGLRPAKALEYAQILQRSVGCDVFVTVSLDGDEALHDSIRGVPGNYASAIATHRLLKSHGIPVHFGITLSEDNEPFVAARYQEFRDDMKAVTLVHSEGIYRQPNRVDDVAISRSLRTIDRLYRVDGMGTLIEKAFIRIGLQFLEHRRSENIVPCAVGDTSVHVRPTGAVHHCMFLAPVGNVKDRRPLSAMLDSEPSREMLRKVRRDECPHCWMNCYAPHSILMSPLRSSLHLLRRPSAGPEARGREGAAVRGGVGGSTADRAPRGGRRNAAPLRLSVLIPAYDEESTIGEVLRRVMEIDLRPLGVAMEVIVCDDGSSDGTAVEVRRLQRAHRAIRLVSHARNRGKGSAIRSALAEAAGDYVLIQDADLEYDVRDYPVLLEAARNGAPVVYGSRFLRRRFPNGMRRPNYLANRLLTAAANALFKLRLSDEATCLKLVRTDLLRSLGLTSERFEFCAEVTAKLALLGVPIVEVPVRYQAREVDDGKKVRWVDGVQSMATLVRLRMQTPLPAGASSAVG